MTSHMQDLGLNFSTPKVTKLEPGVMTHPKLSGQKQACLFECKANVVYIAQPVPGLHRHLSEDANWVGLDAVFNDHLLFPGVSSAEFIVSLACERGSGSHVERDRPPALTLTRSRCITWSWVMLPYLVTFCTGCGKRNRVSSIG